MTADQLGRNTELSSQLSDLIFEKLAQRLNQLEAMASHKTFSNASHVVMSLYRLRGSLEGDTLDDILKVLAR